MKALLALEDGRIFPCRSFTGPGETSGEAVFNTSMTGYQEVLTDPSYKGQMVTMTYPLIGNYGINPEDIESAAIHVSAFIVREYQDFPSNYRSTSTLAEYLKSYGVMGVDELDTRALTKHLRTNGALRGIISTIDLDPESLVRKAKAIPTMAGQDLARVVTTEKAYFWVNGEQKQIQTDIEKSGPEIWPEDKKLKLVAFDFGIKFNILRSLERAGFSVLVVPAFTSAEAVKKIAPQAIFLSNGPGDPEPLTYAINTIKDLIGFRPIFGICLGNQLLGLAMGGKTFKLKFGHRGGNQPVQNKKSGKIEITSQNHGFAVDLNSLDINDLEITHMNLNDNTLEGFRHKKLPIFTVQHHPEASPGPHDSGYLFEEFAEAVKAFEADLKSGC